MIRTNVIDPIYHSNARTELRLDVGKVYKGGLRLGNLGCSTVTIPADRFLLYNTTSGVLSLIKNIYLYDGNVLLDQLLEAHHMFAFRAIQNTDLVVDDKNAFNFNMNQQLVALTNSYYVEQDPNGTDTRAKKLDANPMSYYNYAYSDSADTFTGWVNLTAHFEFLKNMQYTLNNSSQSFIDTNVFKNFRVVIEWRSAAELKSCFQGKSTLVSADILRPQLYCDEVVGASLPQSIAFNYDVYELDKLVCGSSAGAGTIPTKARLNGFNGKFLKKLLLMNVDPAELTADANGDGIKCDGSQCFNETLQLYINGEQLFDFNGIDSDSRRLTICSDAWGALNVPLGSYGLMSQDLTPLLTQQVLDLKGRMSYTGCMVGQPITELQVEHKRVVPGPASAFMMFVWGEVPKQISVSNGQYTIKYL